jgi:hypothetical protein
MVNACLYPYDTEKAQKIRLSERIIDDHIAGHYERSDVFSVKNAYKLALEEEQAELPQESTSVRPDGI